MSNYKITRQEVADKLDISVRSVDRYIKSGKLRSKKKGKIVFVNINDVDNMSGDSGDKKHIIIREAGTKKDKTLKDDGNHSKKIVKKADYDKLTKTFEKVYGDLQTQIEKKDDVIQKLSIQVGQAQEQVKHSISVSEHNRSQMLIEESRQNMTKQMGVLNQDREKLEKQLKDEKFDKTVLIVFVFVLLVIAAYFWFKSV